MVWSLTTIHWYTVDITTSKSSPSQTSMMISPSGHPHPIPLKSGPRTTSDNSSFMEPRKFVKIISLLSPIKLSGLLASQLCLPLWMRSFAAVWNFPLLLIKYIRAKSESLILGWLTNYGLVFGAGHLALLTPTLNQCC